MDYEVIVDCLACATPRTLSPVLNLGKTPLANSYLTTSTEKEDLYHLNLWHCEECDHLQLGQKIDPDKLFKNYLYTSGTSKTGIEHFKSFVNITSKYVKNIKNVLDVACNDGSQLDQFADLGYNTYGIDPAKNLFELSSKKSTIISDYINSDNVKSFGVKFDVIVAQNVFAHIDYNVQFLTYCASVLEKDGCIFIQTSQANMVENYEFDTIYHEHLSFFSVKSMIAVIKRANLKLIDVQTLPIHGTSYLFVISKDGEDKSDLFQTLYKEHTADQINDFRKMSHQIIFDLKDKIKELKSSGYKIIGYGASAKGNTLLNSLGIATTDTIDYIVDDNKLKVGLFTPGARIPIKTPDALKDETGKVAILLLAWNFFDEIKLKVEQRVKNPIFIKYYPKIEVIASEV